MFNTIIIRNGEVAIKGENRPVFEKKLMTNIKKALYGMQIQGYKVYKGEGRIYIDADPEIMDQVIEKVRNVFGVVTLSPAIKAEKGYEKLKEMCLEVFEDAIANGEYKTFKMDVKRQNKSFHMTSPEMTKDIAGYILSKHGDKIGVDVFKPELTVYAEFRLYLFYINLLELYSQFLSIKSKAIEFSTAENSMATFIYHIL
jgi:thiamine biosynthesis protein ThiI